MLVWYLIWLAPTVVQDIFAERSWLRARFAGCLFSYMFGVTTSDDYRPVAWMGRYPVDVTTILVIAHVAAMIGACLLFFAGATTFFSWLAFDSAAVLQAYAFHQLVTYAFVHSPADILWFAFGMYMLFVFGREVERFLGRKAFIGLYSILVIGPSLLLTAWGLTRHIRFAGSSALHLAVFVAFATIYPRAELMFRILAKWAALVIVGALSLQWLAYHAWVELTVLWFSTAAAFLFVELRGAGPELAWVGQLKTLFRPKPRLYVVQKSTARRVVEPDDVYASVDPILDKISKSGIGSLTEGERRQLDRARKRLMNRESKTPGN
jgi:rhomboid family protein